MSDLPRTIRCIEEGMAQGLHPGAQMAVYRDGQLIVDLAFGAARPGVPMTTNTLLLWQSSTKPVAVAAIGQLWQQGKLTLDDPVCTYLAAFGARGKEHITVRHLLTHTGGFRGALLGWSSDPWDALVARICNSRIETGWIPGKRAGYHVGSSWIILGELVRVLDGRPFEQYVREMIFAPAGMADSWIGMPIAQYEAYGERLGFMFDTSTGVPVVHPPHGTPEICTLCRPGANGHGPARELAKFYDTLLNDRRGAGKLLWPQTIEAMTSRARVGLFDHTFRQVVDWGLGFMVDNNLHGAAQMPYPFSPYCSPRTFGHGGSQSSVGFADPEFALAGAVIFNGSPGEVKHHLRIRETLAALYEDLGLDGAIPQSERAR